jgi:uncharacterized protein (TIGR02452 family)
MIMQRNRLIDVYEDTKKICWKMKTREPYLYNIHSLPKFDNSTIYKNEVEVINEDSLNMAMRYKQMGLNPLVLNMASEWKPGGGVTKGSMAQEECLFRRTNAYKTHLKKFYPLKNSDVIYSPKITIVKDDQYRLLNYYEDVSMLAVAAVRRPRLVDGSYSQKDYDVMYDKIKSIFEIGILNKNDSLVLGALGCGAFENPPEEVGKIFEKVVDLYGKHFKRIGFAILVVRDKDQDNFDVFDKIFNKK